VDPRASLDAVANRKSLPKIELWSSSPMCRPYFYPHRSSQSQQYTELKPNLLKFLKNYSLYKTCGYYVNKIYIPLRSATYI